ncbi:HTH domain-containing protein, partial [Mordavella massiliensis]|nr:HTH domain-containing protein [Mordavella massiliensis]
MIEFSHVRHGNEMLLELLNSPSVVSLKTLENKLHLSRRSIFYVIKHVNKELDAEGLYEIENIRGIGYL